MRYASFAPQHTLPRASLHTISQASGADKADTMAEQGQLQQSLMASHHQSHRLGAASLGDGNPAATLERRWSRVSKEMGGASEGSPSLTNLVKQLSSPDKHTASAGAGGSPGSAVGSPDVGRFRDELQSMGSRLEARHKSTETAVSKLAEQVDAMKSQIDALAAALLPKT